MDRKKRFFSGLIAGYGAAAANLIFTVSSVPIALHYLSKEEFGLWALVLQIANFLMLLDLGMSSSVARFLADHKDHKDQDSYGKVLQTGKFVFYIQALAMFLLTLAAGWALPGWLGLPSQLVQAFQRLLWIQGFILAVGLTLRGFSSPLWAHQRIDITHWANAANLITSLLVMAGGFVAGWGVYSFLAGSFIGSLWSWIFPWAACRRLGLFPAKKGGSKFEFSLLLRMVGFGRDILLMQLGGVICSASPLIIVTKLFGLEAAAVFSIATKTLTMGQQLIGRILESAAPGLTEMFVRGERDRFGLRFYQMTAFSLALATVLGIFLVGANREFVVIWTQGKVEWSFLGDFLIGTILISTVASRCFQGAFGMTGELTRVRYLSLFEGILLVLCSLALGGKGGIQGILGVVLLANILVPLFLGALQVFQTIPSITFWRKEVALLVAIYFVASGACWWASSAFISALGQIGSAVLLAITGGFCLLKTIGPFVRRKANFLSESE